MYSKEQLLNQMSKLIELTGNPLIPNQNVIDSWESQKEKLLDLFKGELIITKKVDWETTAEEIQMDMKNNDFCGYITENISEKFKDDRGNINTYSVDEYEKLRLIRHVSSLVPLSKGVLTTSFNLETPFPESRITKFQEGTKITKVLRLIIEKDKIEKTLVEYSKYFNHKHTYGELCLSIHPLDYLTASTNSLGWKSCFNLWGGEWKSSVGALVNSPYTIMAYLKSDKPFTLGTEYNKFEWNNKKYRTYVTFNEEYDEFHVGFGYPYNNAKVVEQVGLMVQELMGVEGYVCNDPYGKKKGEFMDTDGFYNDGTYIIYKPADQDTFTEFQVADRNLCLHCGYEYDGENSGTLYCDDCYPDSYCHCYNCDCSISNMDRDYGNYYYATNTDEYYCEDCGCNLFYCDHCGEYYDLENSSVSTFPVKEHYKVNGREYIEDVEWCEFCVANSIKKLEERTTESGEVYYELKD